MNFKIPLTYIYYACWRLFLMFTRMRVSTKKGKERPSLIRKKICYHWHTRASLRCDKVKCICAKLWSVFKCCESKVLRNPLSASFTFSTELLLLYLYDLSLHCSQFRNTSTILQPNIRLFHILKIYHWKWSTKYNVFQRVTFEPAESRPFAV